MSAAGTVASVMAFAQAPGVPPRSAAYMAGVKAKLQFKVDGKAFPTVYTEGSAEFDAFHAGAQNATGYLEHWTRVGGSRP